MYHYANKPGYSARRVRETINQYFNTSWNGLPGNDGMLAFLYLSLCDLNAWQILVCIFESTSQ